jgi:golgin subfamily B member 1
MAANSDDVPHTVELLCRIAEIEERRLSHQNAAFDVYGRALRIDPTNPDVIAHLERLASETGHWAKLTNLFASEIEKVDEPRRAIDMLLRLARIYEEETGQVEEAIATFRRAVTADADSKDALIALDRLYVRAQQWDDLADIVRREIKVAPSDEDRVALTFRLAQIYELALMDMPKAVEAYREILSTEPTHAETRAALERMFIGGTLELEIADVLEPLYRTGEEWEKLHRSTDRRRRAAGAAAAAGRDRRAEARRPGGGVRVVGAGGQGRPVFGAGARRAAAAGARHAPVGRVRQYDAGDGGARSRPVGAARRVAAPRGQLRE